ncbi:hypothetical protein ABT367_39530, partial [Streptomyces mesophilus]
ASCGSRSPSTSRPTSPFGGLPAATPAAFPGLPAFPAAPAAIPGLPLFPPSPFGGLPKFP